MNKKGNFLVGIGIALLIVVVIVAFFGLWVMGSYNGLVQQDVNTQQHWGNVQTAYQRRADLIPNLVSTVQGAANFEKSTFVEVTEARTKWMSAQSSGSQTAQVQAAQGLDSAIARLLVTFENYPQLKANQNFLALQDELAGTENRIKWERDQYNEAAASYQLKIRSFPTNIVAGMFGFSVDKWATFKADEGAQNAPKVGFNFN